MSFKQSKDARGAQFTPPCNCRCLVASYYSRTIVEMDLACSSGKRSQCNGFSGEISCSDGTLKASSVERKVEYDNGKLHASEIKCDAKIEKNGDFTLSVEAKQISCDVEESQARTVSNFL